MIFQEKVLSEIERIGYKGIAIREKKNTIILMPDLIKNYVICSKIWLIFYYYCCLIAYFGITSRNVMLLRDMMLQSVLKTVKKQSMRTLQKTVLNKEGSLNAASGKITPHNQSWSIILFVQMAVHCTVVFPLMQTMYLKKKKNWSHRKFEMCLNLSK